MRLTKLTIMTNYIMVYFLKEEHHQEASSEKFFPTTGNQYGPVEHVVLHHQLTCLFDICIVEELLCRSSFQQLVTNMA